MKQLVKNLGDQFNLPVHQVKTLDLDKFVDDAIKVEEGELDTLRVKKYSGFSNNVVFLSQRQLCPKICWRKER
jgi:hypothetical protein